MNDVSDLRFSAIASMPAACLQDRRTYIATNYTWPLERQEAAAQHNEMWEYYPDDWPLRSRYQSDSRLALTPFLAHRHALQKRLCMSLISSTLCRRVRRYSDVDAIVSDLVR